MVGYELIQSMSNPLAPALFQAGLSPVFRGGSSDRKEYACSAGDQTQVQFLAQEDPLEKG